jgi:hypothetical protein
MVRQVGDSFEEESKSEIRGLILVMAIFSPLVAAGSSNPIYIFGIKVHVFPKSSQIDY